MQGKCFECCEESIEEYCIAASLFARASSEFGTRESLVFIEAASQAIAPISFASR